MIPLTVEGNIVNHSAPYFQQVGYVLQRLTNVEDMLQGPPVEDHAVSSLEAFRERLIEVTDVVGAFKITDIQAFHGRLRKMLKKEALFGRVSHLAGGFMRSGNPFFSQNSEYVLLRAVNLLFAKSKDTTLKCLPLMEPGECSYDNRRQSHGYLRPEDDSWAFDFRSFLR